MESDRWQQIKELYLAASDREESDRHVFLEQACPGTKTFAMKSSRCWCMRATQTTPLNCHP